jgi:hypothetical protein
MVIRDRLFSFFERRQRVRRSKRDIKASVGKAAVETALYGLQEEHDLTDIEMLQALSAWQQSVLKYMLRYERHGDYETEAGLDK